MFRKIVLPVMLFLGMVSPLWAVEVASIPPIKAILSYLGVQDVVSILPSGSDPHTFELSPSTIMSLSNAKRVWMINGNLEVERKLLRIIKDLYPKIEVVFLSDGLDMIDNDPHQWISLKNLKVLINNASQRLGIKTKQVVIQRVESMDEEFERVFNRLRVENFLSFHPAWRYFCRDYGLKMVALANSGGEVSAKLMYKVLQGCKIGKYRFIVLEKGFDVSRLSSLFESCPIPSIEFNPLSEDILAEFESLLKHMEALFL